MKQLIAILVSFAIILTAIDFIIPEFGFFARVDTGHVGIQKTFGKVSEKVLDSGFHVTNWFTHVIPMDVREKKNTINISAFSSDIQEVNIVETINYQIMSQGARTMYVQIGEDYFEKVIKPRVLENTKVVFSQYNAENLISKRNELSDKIKTNIQNDMDVYGVTIIEISIEDIDFSDAFTNAVEAKQVATQQKLTAETQQAQETAKARAEAERQKVTADAKAYEVKVKADAEAEANKKLAESITPELIDYIRANGWNGEMPTVYMGNDANTMWDMSNIVTSVG